MYIYISALHILLCYANVDVLYSDYSFFVTTDVAAPFTVVLSAYHMAHYYMVFT